MKDRDINVMMKDSKKTKSKQYVKPKLLKFGSVRELTRGGAGGSPEVTMGDMGSIRRA